MDSVISFSDFLYAFQAQFCFEGKFLFSSGKMFAVLCPVPSIRSSQNVRHMSLHVCGVHGQIVCSAQFEQWCQKWFQRVNLQNFSVSARMCTSLWWRNCTHPEKLLLYRHQIRPRHLRLVGARAMSFLRNVLSVLLSYPVFLTFRVLFFSRFIEQLTRSRDQVKPPLTGWTAWCITARSFQSVKNSTSGDFSHYRHQSTYQSNSWCSCATRSHWHSTLGFFLVCRFWMTFVYLEHHRCLYCKPYSVQRNESRSMDSSWPWRRARNWTVTLVSTCSCYLQDTCEKRKKCPPFMLLHPWKFSHRSDRMIKRILSSRPLELRINSG